MPPRLDLTGARVLITGGSGGLGAALARELAASGARLALAARSRERLEEVARDLSAGGAEALAVPTDITEDAQRRRLVDAVVGAFGGLDVLINNAGLGATGAFAEASEDRLRRIFEVNFFAAAELTRLAIPHLARGRDPMIVNISSVIGRCGYPGSSEYCASKFALSGWSDALRAELAGRGIGVLLACPGPVATEFSAHTLEDKLPPPKDLKAVSPAACARLIVAALRRRRPEIVIGGGGKLLLTLNRLFPRLVDRVMARDFARAAPAPAPPRAEAARHAGAAADPADRGAPRS
jgi:short-subunit dehydrogenase